MEVVNEEVEQIEEPEVETIIDDDPLSFLEDDRTPLEKMGEEAPEPPAEPEEEKVEEEEVTTTEPEEKPKKDESAGLQAALLAERQKRQTAEAQLREVAEKPKDFNWENPQETLAEMETRLAGQMQNQFLSMSEAQCISRHEDYGEKYQIFTSMAQANPALINSMLQQPDPAEWAYNQASQKMFTDEVGADPQAYEDKLKAKIRLELEEEFNKKVGDRITAAKTLPPSAASMSDKVSPKLALKDPLDELFPGQIPGG